LSQALIGTTITVPTLDSRKRPLQITEIVNPYTEKRIAGEGLPYPKQTSKKGDIIVKFDIKFPDSLTKQQKDILMETLPKH
jgi:DnaJ-class molecular chaperone